MSRFRLCVVMIAVCSAAGLAGAATFDEEVTAQPYCDLYPDFCTLDRGSEDPLSSKTFQVSGGSFTLSIPNAPGGATGDAVFTLTTAGDYASCESEYFNVAIEGFDVGDFLDCVPEDDLFDNESFGDTGEDCVPTFQASATIPLAQLQTILADGVIEFTFTSPADHDINDFCGDEAGPEEFMTARIVFQYAENVPTTTPWGALALGVLLAAVAVAVLRRLV